MTECLFVSITKQNNKKQTKDIFYPSTFFCMWKQDLMRTAILPCKWTRLFFLGGDGYFQTEIIFWNGLPNVLALTPLKICGPWKERTQFGRIHVDGFQSGWFEMKKRGCRTCNHWLADCIRFSEEPQKSHLCFCDEQKDKKNISKSSCHRKRTVAEIKISKPPQH